MNSLYTYVPTYGSTNTVMIKERAMTEINKCPVCGASASIEESDDRVQAFWYACDNVKCTLVGPTQATEEEAAKAWNRLSYKAPVKKIVKVAWVKKMSGDVPVSFAILLDNAMVKPHYISLGYEVVATKEVEFEIE